MSPAINFSNAPKFDNIPPGRYNAKFEEYENDVAGTDGSDMVKMTYIITEEGEYKGRKAFRNLSLKPTALWMFKRTCIALGIDEAVFDTEEDLDTDEILDDAVGADCRLVIKERTWEGEKRSEIRSVLAPAYEFSTSE